MKTSSSFLYDLIKTLTKTERRYIKVQSGSVEKDYIQLMDALSAQKTFNEEQLFEDYKGANFLKHLAVNKRYLYELILKSLTNFGQKSVEGKIYEKINATNALIKKGLFTAAFSELKKGQRSAKKYELYQMQIMLFSIEKSLLSQRQFKKRDQDTIHKIFQLEADCLTQLQNTNEYWHLNQQIIQFQTRFQKIQTEEQSEQIKTLTQSSKFQDITLATNFKSKIHFLQANATYQFILGNVEQAQEINKQFLDLLDTKPHFLHLYAERYLATLNNMLIDSLVIGKYDLLNEGIKRLDKLVQRSEFQSIKNIKSRIFRQRYLLLINWSLRQKDFEKAMELIPEIEEGLVRFGNKIEKYHRITFYYLIAYLLFQNKRFEQVLKWNNLIMNDQKEDVVKEIYYFARSLNLLTHYELGNHTLLESLLLSTPKYLRARRSIYATEKALFKLLGKLLNTIDKTKKQKFISNFKSELGVLFQKPKEKRVFNYLDLRLWDVKG